jgi:hypothetical protein
MESAVTTTEFYYLLLVLGAFGAFAAAMSLATIQYRAWLRGTKAPKPARSTSARRLVDAA